MRLYNELTTVQAHCNAPLQRPKENMDTNFEQEPEQEHEMNTIEVSLNEAERAVAETLNDKTVGKAVLDAVDELAARETEIQDLQTEIGKLQDQFTRQLADFQNYRRRTEMEIARASQYGRDEVTATMLDHYDDLKRSLEVGNHIDFDDEANASFAAFRSGIQLIYDNFTRTLEKLNVKPIPAVGELFDERFHEALMQQPASEEVTSGTILNELQVGYCVGERVLRHSKVVVAVWELTMENWQWMIKQSKI